MAFVHLHSHSEFSLLDGKTKIYSMVKRAAELGMPAVALTDHGVMSGLPELENAVARVEAETGVHVKPIFGCEIYFCRDESLKTGEGHARLNHLILLAKTEEGYYNMVKLVSESHVNNFYYKPRTTLPMLNKYGKGLMATSACIAGIIPKTLDVTNLTEECYKEAKDWACKLAGCFAPGDFYIELQNQEYITDAGLTQTELNRRLTRLAYDCGFKTIASNDFHYLLQKDAVAQDILLCIGTGSKVTQSAGERLKMEPDQFYMKTEEEMLHAMADFPEACANTVEVAEKVEEFSLKKDPILPNFKIPDGHTLESYFKTQIEDGLKWRYPQGISSEVRERADYESKIIIEKGFPAYFLIVQEYISWARSNDIAVGPGRGSAAGSLVSYVLGITDLDPLENGLLFERFLSIERTEMPDIDVDFEQGRRADVLQHIKDFYGEDHISGVITFQTIQAKNAVKDAARVLDYPYSLGERIAKLIGNDLGITLTEALGEAVGKDGEPIPGKADLINAYRDDEDVRRVIDAARSIEGNIRGEGVHACATIISNKPMTDNIPVKRDTKAGSIITQYDGHITPDLGMLKMDFLGLKNLDIINGACRNIKKRYGIDINPSEIPLNDSASFALMNRGDMDGLFQVESPLYVGLFHRLPPKRFSDVVASIALNRPGPLESGMVDDYIEVASGRRKPSYYDDRLKDILEETFGTIVYQEQIMQISMKMSGFSAGRADVLRKAMGKKKKDVMDSLKIEWEEGAVANGYNLAVAQKIWSDAEKFAKYAFNKSHSAAYAVIVMRTAYLKAHYPEEFMASVLSINMKNNDSLMKYVNSTKKSGIKILVPDINSSDMDFTPLDGGIRFGLAGIRNVGASVAKAIITQRNSGGPYANMHDFIKRLDPKYWTRKTLEALIKCGSFDSTGYTRKQLWELVDQTNLLEEARESAVMHAEGQESLFANLGVSELKESDLDSFNFDSAPEPDGIEWPERQMLAFEKEIMNNYVTRHPLDSYMKFLSPLSKFTISDLLEKDHSINNATFVGMISNITVKYTKRGKKMALFTLEDPTGYIDVIVFDLEKFHNAVFEDSIVMIKGKLELGDRGRQIVSQRIECIDLPSLHEEYPEKMEIFINSCDYKNENGVKLKNVLSCFKGIDPVFLMVKQTDGRIFKANLQCSVDSRNKILQHQIIEIFGKNCLTPEHIDFGF